MRRAVAPLLSFLLIALPAAAQERAPMERSLLLELSYVLGQSHALRQACQGADDQYWRQRMMRLVEVEQADQGFDAQMRERFNTGFAAGQGQHSGCDGETHRAQAVAAARGQALSARLSSVMLSPQPQEPEVTP